MKNDFQLFLSLFWTWERVSCCCCCIFSLAWKLFLTGNLQKIRRIFSLLPVRCWKIFSLSQKFSLPRMIFLSLEGSKFHPKISIGMLFVVAWVWIYLSSRADRFRDALRENFFSSRETLIENKFSHVHSRDSRNLRLWKFLLKNIAKRKKKSCERVKKMDERSPKTWYNLA